MRPKVLLIIKKILLSLALQNDLKIFEFYLEKYKLLLSCNKRNNAKICFHWIQLKLNVWKKNQTVSSNFSLGATPGISAAIFWCSVVIVTYICCKKYLQNRSMRKKFKLFPKEQNFNKTIEFNIKCTMHFRFDRQVQYISFLCW